MSSTLLATAIMQYPNALNRNALQTLQKQNNHNTKTMTVFKSNTYSLETVKTMLQYYDPDLAIMTNKETGKLFILKKNINKHVKTIKFITYYY